MSQKTNKLKLSPPTNADFLISWSLPAIPHSGLRTQRRYARWEIRSECLVLLPNFGWRSSLVWTVGLLIIGRRVYDTGMGDSYEEGERCMELTWNTWINWDVSANEYLPSNRNLYPTFFHKKNPCLTRPSLAPKRRRHCERYCVEIYNLLTIHLFSIVNNYFSIQFCLIKLCERSFIRETKFLLVSSFGCQVRP